MSLQERFLKLGTDHAPGQEARSRSSLRKAAMLGGPIEGQPVDFSHGDVDAFQPSPGSFEAFSDGVAIGGEQAYTEYRGHFAIREAVALRLAAFTGASVDGSEGLIITPGTQAALFLAIACTVSRGDKVAIVEPDYFANRKIVEFFEGHCLPIRLDYLDRQARAGLDLDQLEAAFKAGAKVFVFSNPNNPTGTVYSRKEVARIAELASRHGATVIVDQLYSRLVYSGAQFVHLRAQMTDGAEILTIMGPSKTESLSGYRLGVAFGSQSLVDRMEKLQAIVSLRAPGYSQSVLRTWFNEPQGWLTERLRLHQGIRDDLVNVLRSTDGLTVRSPDAGSYLFPRLPPLSVPYLDFVRFLRLQAAVTVTPGTEFAAQSGSSIRLNFSQDHMAAIEAVKRLVELIERYRQ